MIILLWDVGWNRDKRYCQCECSFHGKSPPTIMSGATPNLGSLMSYKQELLGDDNWVAWKLRMTNVFSLHKVIDHVVSHIPKLDISDVTALAEWTDKDEKAKMLLFMSVGNDNLVHLSDSETAAQMWDNLRAVYKVKGHQTIIALRCSLYHLAADTNNDIPKHLIEMKQMWSRLHQLSSVISKSEFCDVLFHHCWECGMGSSPHFWDLAKELMIWAKLRWAYKSYLPSLKTNTNAEPAD